MRCIIAEWFSDINVCVSVNHLLSSTFSKPSSSALLSPVIATTTTTPTASSARTIDQQV